MPKDKNGKTIEVGMTLKNDRHPDIKFKVVMGDAENSIYDGTGNDYIADGDFIKWHLTDEWAKGFTIIDS